MKEAGSSISRSSGTVGWLWNFRPGNEYRHDPPTNYTELATATTSHDLPVACARTCSSRCTTGPGHHPGRCHSRNLTDGRPNNPESPIVITYRDRTRWPTRLLGSPVDHPPLQHPKDPTSGTRARGPQDERPGRDPVHPGSSQVARTAVAQPPPSLPLHAPPALCTRSPARDVGTVPAGPAAPLDPAHNLHPGPDTAPQRYAEPTPGARTTANIRNPGLDGTPTIPAHRAGHDSDNRTVSDNQSISTNPMAEVHRPPSTRTMT